jgi:PAS domain S-box-containing protein
MVFLMDGIIISLSIEGMHRFREKYSRELKQSTEAHAALKENTRHHSSILDNIFAYVALLDTHGVIQEINKGYLEHAGLTRDSVIGKYFYDMPLWSYDENIRSQLKRAIEAASQGKTQRFDVTVKMGYELVPIDLQISPVLDDNGNIIGVLPTGVDISERKAVENALRESENKFHVLFEAATDCLMLLSEDGRILDINHVGYERLGYTKEEMLGRRIAEFDPPEFACGVQERVAKIIRDGHAIFESAHLHKLGSRMPVEISCRQIDLNGERILFSAIRDISERKQAEETLLASKANLHAMLDNSPYLTWLKDADGRYITINKVFADFLRLDDPEQATGKTDFDLQPKELAEKYRADDGEVMAARKRKHIEEAAFNGNDTFWVETFKTPIIDANDKVLGTVGFANDITERKKLEETLKVAAVVFDSHDAIMITDKQANIIRVNQAFTDITGYHPEEVLGQNPRMMNSGRQDKAFYIELWQQLQHTGSWSGEIWDKRKSGQIYPKWLTITAVKNDQQETTHYVAIFSDITARKQTEEEIRNLAFYDSLTQLPNRRLFMDRFRAALTISTRRNDYGALLFIDLDRFKSLKESLIKS